ncbi:putative leucine-rich repeat domain superfamily, F-box-like domain superfamily [Helianthus annuus]|nr:putative leucine-rich repeat domain superfamily, F-box-like domain superfamily [Helianthus annuus]
MSLPDELWRWILELGVNTSCLTYKDLCCISMSCRRLNRLSKEDVLWSKLLSFDFPAHVSSSTDRQSPKSIYQIRFEKDKVKKLLAERRAVLRIESRIHEHTRKLHEIEGRLVDENEKHISGFLRARKDENNRLEAAKERLSKVKYHPLQSFGLDDESRNSRKSTGKNLKRVKHV